MADEYTLHEALDRTSIVLGIIDDYLRANDAIAENTLWMALVERAHDALFMLYQEIGVVHLPNGVDNPQTR